MKFAVRSTVTTHSLHRMKETVEYFHSLGIMNFHFEPVYECGRCITSNIEFPNPELFANEFIESLELAEDYGMSLHYSGGSITGRSWAKKGFTHIPTGVGPNNSIASIDARVNLGLDLNFNPTLTVSASALKLNAPNIKTTAQLSIKYSSDKTACSIPKVAKFAPP